MATCSDEQCRKDLRKSIDGVKKTLYGETGTEGLVDDVKGKVSWTTVMVIALALISIAAAQTWRTSDQWDVAANERHLNKEEILVLKSDREQTKQDIQEIKKEIKEINRKQIDPDHFLREIKETIKENSN